MTTQVPCLWCQLRRNKQQGKLLTVEYSDFHLIPVVTWCSTDQRFSVSFSPGLTLLFPTGKCQGLNFGWRGNGREIFWSLVVFIKSSTNDSAFSPRKMILIYSLKQKLDFYFNSVFLKHLQYLSLKMYIYKQLWVKNPLYIFPIFGPSLRLPHSDSPHWLMIWTLKPFHYAVYYKGRDSTWKLQLPMVLSKII